MATLKVFVDMMSQPSRSILLLLKANKIPFSPQVIDIAKGMHLTDKEFGEANPNKKVPAIKDGNFKLFECTAIMKYICQKYDLSDHWYPADINKRARIDEYLSWHHTNTRLAAIDITWGKIFLPKLLGKPVNEAKINRGKNQMAQCMKIYDAHFLKDTLFLSSEKITIADLLALCEFTQLDLLPPDFVEISPTVQDWLERCKSHFGSDYDDVHSILWKVRSVLASKL